jgi:hypothetical protein
MFVPALPVLVLLHQLIWECTPEAASVDLG